MRDTPTVTIRDSPSTTPKGRLARTRSSGTKTSSTVMSLLAVPRMPRVSQSSRWRTPPSLGTANPCTSRGSGPEVSFPKTLSRSHAGASGVRVSAERAGQDTVVRIADDGRGFDPASARSGLGLMGMRERAVLAGGSVILRSAPKTGTVVELRVGGGA